MKTKYIYKVNEKYFIEKTNARKYMFDEIRRITDIVDKIQTKIAHYNRLAKELNNTKFEGIIPEFYYIDNVFYYNLGDGKETIVLEKIKLSDGRKK